MNNKVAVIVDSSSGIKNGEYENVFVVPLIINQTNLKTKEQKDYRDGVDIKPSEFIDLFKDKNLNFKTSQASMQYIYDLLDEVCSKYEDVYVVPICKHLSGSYNSWLMIKEDYPNLVVVNNEDIAVGMRQIVEDIINKSSLGLDSNAIINYLETDKKNRYGMLVVNDPTYLARGGRISSFAKTLIKILNLKIMIEFKLKLNFFDKAKNLESCLEKMERQFQDEIDYKKRKIKKAVIYLMYPDGDPEAEVVKNAIKKKFTGIKFEFDTFSPVITCHTGPRSFAVYILVG